MRRPRAPFFVFRICGCAFIAAEGALGRLIFFNCSREAAPHIERAQGCGFDICSREPWVRIELAQGYHSPCHPGMDEGHIRDPGHFTLHFCVPGLRPG